MSWDDAADGYEAYYVPRFAPWVDDAVAAVSKETLPDGPVAVPCCGTFPELGPLREALPGRELVGVDLSEGMLRIAAERAAGAADVRLVRADASKLDAGTYAAVVSVFGLQQIPDPAAAIGSWTAALRPGGRLSVVFWPKVTETDGPFARMAAVLPGPRSDRGWEDRLGDAVAVHDGDIEADRLVAHPMEHPDAGAFFDSYLYNGPLRPLLAQRGPEFVAQLRETFLRDAPTAAPWRHRPRARHIVAVRRGGGG